VIIHRHVTHLPPEAQGGVVAVGNFDGVHRGHQAVMGEAVRLARADTARTPSGSRPAGSSPTPAAVLTFEPHPRRFFKPDAPPFLLTRFRTKARVIAVLGVDRLFVLRFDAWLAGRTAGEFIADVLIGGLKARHVVIGYDFVFGKGRGGTPEFLRDTLTAQGIGVTVLPAVTMVDAQAEAEPEAFVVSSTGVRDALRDGDPRAAARLLGRPFEIEARVMRGDQRGRTIGFPTANLWLTDYLRPALGVYAVRVAIADPHPLAESAIHKPVWRDGVANLGLRPTFGGLAEPRLEVHLFDFNGDLYGRILRVALIEFLRPERRFDGIEALKAQIILDADEARRILAAPPPRRAAPPRLEPG
jgi:riboflavin kinase/FMN adenylyltransferase